MQVENSTQEMISNLEKTVRSIIQESADSNVESALIEKSVDDICLFTDEARMKMKGKDEHNPYAIAKRTVKLWRKHIRKNAKLISTGINKLR
jgi:hypothetical protein